MATGFVPAIIVPRNPAPLPAGFVTGGVRSPAPQQIWPGAWTGLATAGTQLGSPGDPSRPELPPGFIPPLPDRPTRRPDIPGDPSRPELPPGFIPPLPDRPTRRPDIPDTPGPPPPIPTPPLPPQPGDNPEDPFVPWKPDVTPYIQQLLDYLNARKQGWQQQYRGLGNTPTSWYDWMLGQNSQPVTDWIRQNWLPSWANEGQNDPDLGLGLWNEGTTALNSAFQNWLRQNSVNYTNPIRLPMPNRMRVPVTDWTRLAGPEYGIPSGFSERATKSPWTADYRGGAFGPTGRVPSWTTMAQ